MTRRLVLMGDEEVGRELSRGYRSWGTWVVDVVFWLVYGAFVVVVGWGVVFG